MFHFTPKEDNTIMDHKKIRDFIDNDNYQELLPFVSTIEMDSGDIYKGVILNLDKTMISFIDISKIKNNDELYEFIELCLDWWWYSSRVVPVNLFYPNETQYYLRQYTTHLPNKLSVIIKGHQVSLSGIVQGKKFYRKNISLNTKD